MVSIEEARSQVETRKAQVATAQRGIQARQAALPQTGTQRALRTMGGIAGVPAKQRVETERKRLKKQQEVVGEYGKQLGKYEKQVAKAEAKKATYGSQRSSYAQERREWKQAEKIVGRGLRYDPKSSVGRKVRQLTKGQRMAEQRYDIQVGELEAKGFEAVYDKGKLTGFSDPHAKMSIPIEQFEQHMKQYAAPQVAYKDILTGEMEYTSKMGPDIGQIPVVISAAGRELGVVEQMKLQAMKPELFGAPRLTSVPKWEVQPAHERTVIEKIKDLPAKGWETISGRTPRETYGFIFEPEGRPVPGEAGLVYEPITSKKVAWDVGKTVAGVSVAALTAAEIAGIEVAAVIPEYGLGIKVREARVVPERWVEKPAWVPEFGTAMPEEYKVKEFRRKEVYAPVYVFGAKRVKEAVEVGVPLGATLATWQAVPAKLIAPAIAGVSAIEVAKAQKEISELKEQKIDIDEIKAEITALKADVGVRPFGVTDKDWAKYESEYLVAVEEYETEYLTEAERYNKEIEAAIAAQKTARAIGVAGVGLGAVIGARQIAKYAKAEIVKPLPYEIPEPMWITPQVKKIDPLTGKVVIIGKPRVDIPIPAKEAFVQKRWEKWIGREPKLVEITKPKVKYVWADKPVVEGKPALYYETRAVSPETLEKFKAGKIKLFVKPRITGGPSVPTTLAELKELPKAQQEMWRRMATQVQYGTPASLERTSDILKKFQKIKGKTIEFSPLEPLGRKFKTAWTTTIVEPVTKVIKPTKFGLVTEEISKDAPFEIFKARTVMKDITKVTVTPARAVGKMPGVREIIIRQKGIIGDEPSKVGGVTPAKVDKVPTPKIITEMASPVLLPKPSLPISKVPTLKVVVALPEPVAVTRVAAPSVWVGKGMYEKVDVGVISDVKLGIPLLPERRVEEIAKVEVSLIPAQILKPALKPIQIIKPEMRPALKPEIRIMPVVKSVVGIRPAVKPAVRIAFKPVMKPVIRPVMKPVVRPTISPRPVPKLLKPIKPIKPIIILIKEKRPIRKPLVKVRPIKKVGYEVEVKRKGEWEDVTPYAISKGEALALGRIETKAGAEVSFRLKKVNGVGGSMGLIPISEAELREEYRGKMVKGKEVKEPLTFIQKRKARIATPGELLAITAKGIKKRRASAKKIKPKKKVIKW